MHLCIFVYLFLLYYKLSYHMIYFNFNLTQTYMEQSNCILLLLLIFFNCLYIYLCLKKMIVFVVLSNYNSGTWHIVKLKNIVTKNFHVTNTLTLLSKIQNSEDIDK